MGTVYSSGFEPNPYDALDVLAFVLCPVRAFAMSGDAAEIAAVEQLIGPAKAEAVKRWHDAFVERKLN